MTRLNAISGLIAQHLRLYATHQLSQGHFKRNGKDLRRPHAGLLLAQEDGPGIGRISMRQILNASAECLMPFVRDSVAPGSTLHTDGWPGYLPLKSNGYKHDVTIDGFGSESNRIPDAKTNVRESKAFFPKLASVGCSSFDK